MVSGCFSARGGSGKMVRAGGLEPPRALHSTDFRTDYGFRRPAARVQRLGGFAVWTIPSPCPGISGVRCCPSSLYTFPARMPPPGLARDCHYRFPRIWAVLHRRFPGEHSSFASSPLRLPFPPRPHRGRMIWLPRGICKARARAGKRRCEPCRPGSCAFRSCVGSLQVPTDCGNCVSIV